MPRALEAPASVLALGCCCLVAMGSCAEKAEDPSSDVGGAPITDVGPDESRADRSARPCHEQWVRRGIERFLRAASRGSEAKIRRSVAEEPAFRMFSHGLNYGREPRKFFSSGKREEVIRHLVARWRQGDRMRLAHLDRTTHDRSFEICNFGFRIERRIRGGPWREFVGKGALDQPTKTVAVWNTGGEVTR